ncbi:MAG: glycosyltransferase family 9 protein [Bacteroidota bacterium]
MQRILIIQTAFLGDVILATPVVSELKRLFPDAKVDFLVKKGNESLLENNPHLNEVFVFDKSKGKWLSMWRLIQIFRAKKYDLVINLHRFGSSGFITALSGAKKKYGFKKNPFSFTFSKKFDHKIGNGEHEVSRNLSVIAEFGATKMIQPQLYPSLEHKNKVDALALSNYFCFAPASVWFTKQLPKHKWIELISIKAKKGQIVLLGGKEDVAFCQEIIDQSGIEAKNLAGKLNLLESAYLMSKAKMNFVNDSGPLHLASSMNAPVTAFFCSTIPEFGFGPLSDDSTVLQTTEKLDCRPCGLHGYRACPMGHFKCGEVDLEGC